MKPVLVFGGDKTKKMFLLHVHNFNRKQRFTEIGDDRIEILFDTIKKDNCDPHF